MKVTSDASRFGRPLRDFFSDGVAEQAVDWLRAYYSDRLERPDGRSDWRYSGSQFERLADRAHPDEFTADDLIAVSMLGVTVPAHAAIWILGDGRSRLRELLHEIGVDRPITDARVTDETLSDDSAAGLLWRELRALPDVGRVITSKLMAAKRPALIPVIDQHVERLLEAPKAGFWVPMRHAMVEDGHLVEAVLTAADIGPSVTPLRAADVVVWLHAHGRQWLPSHLLAAAGPDG